MNLRYCGKRRGEDSETISSTETMWNFPDCICGCAINSHGAINSVQRLYTDTVAEPVQDWIDFLHHGDVTFDLDVRAPALCPVDFDCSIVAPPQDAPTCTGAEIDGVRTDCPPVD